MKKSLLIILLMAFTTLSFAGRKELKANLESCEAALKHCMASKGAVTDTIIIYNTEESAKVVKLREKTKKKAIKTESKRENKVLKQTKTKERHKTKRNFVFQFFQTVRTFIGSLTIGELFGGGAGVTGFVGMVGGLFEKFRPISSFVGLFRKKEED